MADSGKSRPTGPTLEEAEKIHAYRIDRKPFFCEAAVLANIMFAISSPGSGREGTA